MKKRILLSVLICLYLAIIFPFTSYLQNKPFIEKIGYMPEPGVMKLLSADQHQFVAASLLMKVITYFGGLMEHPMNKPDVKPEYYGMYKMIESAVQLDPYNMDSYYFAQAIMVWGDGKVSVTNELLKYGMKYRDWDFYLPFFAGFNYAFFFKDYANAAKYYQRVGELTGADFPMNLAGRYMYESGQTDLAIAYLTLMVKGARNDAVKISLQTRLSAFLNVRRIEQASDGFTRRFHRPPRSIDELVSKGSLTEHVVDPYGGKFYIDPTGKVRSTSKFAFGVVGRSQ